LNNSFLFFYFFFINFRSRFIVTATVRSVSVKYRLYLLILVGGTAVTRCVESTKLLLYGGSG